MTGRAPEVAGSPETEGPAAEIVERARNGDRLAFNALYEQFAPVVHAVIISGVPSSEVDDVMQDVFLAAWRGIGKLRQAEHVGAWLATIARNRLRKLWRQKRHQWQELPTELAAPQAGGGEEILAVLRGLPESYRETLAMRFVEGMTGPEISEATGMTPGSVRVNLFRGMKMLREKLKREGWQ